MPFDIRNSIRLKIKSAKHFWNMTLTDHEQPEDEWSFQSSDDGGYVFKFKVYLPKYTSCRKKWNEKDWTVKKFKIDKNLARDWGGTVVLFK